MTKLKSYPLIITAALLMQACYSSNTPVNVDARDDGVEDDTLNDDGTDVPLDDAILDPVPDDSSPDENPDVPPAQYSLHEWGVMVMDGDGGSMHGPAPEFSGAIPAKPVIYLYSDRDIGPLNIGVDFASGAATEVWPEIVMGQHIAWNGLSISTAPCVQTPFPSMWDGDPLDDGSCEACALGICLVDEAGCLSFPDAAGNMIYSKLLFYTGRLPEYRTPLRASVGLINEPDLVDRMMVSIENSSPYAIENIWFIYRQTFDTCIDPSACPVTAADIAFTYIERMERDSGLSTALDVMHYEAPVDEYGYPIGDLPLPQEWLDLGKNLVTKLVRRGLTDAEAGAFLRSWESVFFGLMGSDAYYIEPLYSNGPAIMYFMDRADYDAQLRLAAVPPPVETVRVGMVYEKLAIGI